MIGSLGSNTPLTNMARITDGTSNTILLGERVGGGEIFAKRTIDSARTTSDGPANGGAWGDLLNGEHWVGGSLYDGQPGTNGGPCIMNCTNSRNTGYYSFHEGGAQFLMGDGVVRFVSANIAASTFAALITRAGDEIVGEF
ncbi:DUF1559 family PulG-like putative transporter [Planctomicrobium sp. SH527]|uniref:DUF1559 family PulG-like putative transporter n=1 Tax=Planctomicrobium sp. SH527 TaxID=3448123 RepID=UPI003F5B9167